MISFIDPMILRKHLRWSFGAPLAGERCSTFDDITSSVIAAVPLKPKNRAQGVSEQQRSKIGKFGGYLVILGKCLASFSLTPFPSSLSTVQYSTVISDLQEVLTLETLASVLLPPPCPPRSVLEPCLTAGPRDRETQTVPTTASAA